ncbi:hypothetical protein H0266_08105 [Halobacillus locisalis]|uniref:Uncharacterized protein n=1 Tax=Halobacillus locisalis TaxID=220753 RepID=A0A838CSL5_9BACI|nr:hypothetical protein [Halobacillus locisalis]MBA2174853.1 hypothetical protein [Halobacillus locisalis]
MSFILPGDPSVPWSSLKDTMDRKVVIIQESNISKQVGFTSEQITEEVYESKKMIKRIQTLKSDLLGDIEAISIISKDTFKPYKHKISTKGSFKKVEYFESFIRLTQGDSENDIKKENPLFENHSVEMVIRLLPFHQGYITNHFAFHPGKEHVINVVIRVVSKEFVKKCGVDFVESWKVEVNFEGNIQFYWISINDKELLKQENILSPDTKMIFERE